MSVAVESYKPQPAFSYEMEVEETINYEYLYRLQLKINEHLNLEIENMKQKYAKLEEELVDTTNTLLQLQEDTNTGPVETTADENGL